MTKAVSFVHPASQDPPPPPRSALFPLFSSLTICLPITTLSPPLSASRLAHLSFSHLFFFPFPTPALCFAAFFHTHIFLHPPNSSQVDWPLNIIITDSCTNKYNRLFSFLLQLKHMVWSLREVWFHLKRTGERVAAFDRGPARPTLCLGG